MYRYTETYFCQSPEKSVGHRYVDVIVDSLEDILFHLEQLIMCVSIITQVEKVIYQWWTQLLKKHPQTHMNVRVTHVQHTANSQVYVELRMYNSWYYGWNQAQWC